MKTQLLAAMSAFISQRSGLDARNYGGSRDALMGDYNSILRSGRDARKLLRFVEMRGSITEEMLRDGFRAYSGRLSIVENEKGIALDYTTGQYFPTEYRNAACAVLAAAIWSWLLSDATAETAPNLRKWAKREFGRGIASRWFN